MFTCGHRIVMKVVSSIHLCFVIIFNNKYLFKKLARGWRETQSFCPYTASRRHIRKAIKLYQVRWTRVTHAADNCIECTRRCPCVGCNTLSRHTRRSWRIWNTTPKHLSDDETAQPRSPSNIFRACKVYWFWLRNSIKIVLKIKYLTIKNQRKNAENVWKEMQRIWFVYCENPNKGLRRAKGFLLTAWKLLATRWCIRIPEKCRRFCVVSASVVGSRSYYSRCTARELYSPVIKASDHCGGPFISRLDTQP